MAKSKKDKTDILSLRIPHPIMRGLVTLAEREERSTTDFIRRVLTKVVEQNKFEVER